MSFYEYITYLCLFINESASKGNPAIIILDASLRGSDAASADCHSREGGDPGIIGCLRMIRGPLAEIHIESLDNYRDVIEYNKGTLFRQLFHTFKRRCCK